MENYLISEAIGDIAGSAYEGRSHRIKDYDKVKLFSSRAHFTDDTVLTFACTTALTVFHLKNGKDKEFVREQLLNKYNPDWANQKYADFHDSYTFNSTCAGTVGPAMICFLESKDYVDCIKLAISLGGDADTLAAIAGPMAYAYYKKMPDALVYQAMKKLPDWMVDVSERFDKIVYTKFE